MKKLNIFSIFVCAIVFFSCGQSMTKEEQRKCELKFQEETGIKMIFPQEFPKTKKISFSFENSKGKGLMFLLPYDFPYDFVPERIRTSSLKRATLDFSLLAIPSYDSFFIRIYELRESKAPCLLGRYKILDEEGEGKLKYYFFRAD